MRALSLSLSLSLLKSVLPPLPLSSTMIVQWTTRDGLNPAVSWGTTRGYMRGPFLGDFITYTPSDFCGAPANSTGFVNPGALNYAKIVVPRGAKIFYKFGSAVS